MHIRTGAQPATTADDGTSAAVGGSASDGSGGSGIVRMSPGAVELSELERGAAVGSGVGSVASSPRSACRPSPQLMAALQAHDHSEARRTNEHSGSNQSAADRSPHLNNVAGHMPPGLALERAAIMTPPPANNGNRASPPSHGAAASVPASAHSPVFYTSQWPPRSAHQSPKLYAQLHQARSMSPATTTSSGPSTPPNPQADQQQQGRGRSWSMGPSSGRSPRTVRTFASNMTPPFGAVAIRRQMLGRQSFDGLHMLQLHRAGLSMAADAAGDEDAENQQLLPSARVLRNRSHSTGAGAPLVSAPMLSEPMGGAWSSKGSRVAIYCASAVLFVLIFLFFMVVALRLAAHAKYDNGACVLRNQQRAREQAGGGPAPYRPPGVKVEQGRWVPEYRWDMWDRPGFVKNLKEKWAREAQAEREWAKREAADSTAAVAAPAAAAAVALPTAAELHARASEVFDAGAWLSLLRLNHFKVM
jgi:hypothetical protein